MSYIRSLGVLFYYKLCIMKVKWGNGLILLKTHISLKPKCSRFIYSGSSCLLFWTWKTNVKVIWPRENHLV